MADFDVDAFIGGTPASPSAPQTPQGITSFPQGAAPAAAKNVSFDPDRFLNDGQAKDPNTGADTPLAYSGNTPDTAQNKSPLSAWDRLSLSTGNLKGNLAYLQKKYGNVQPIVGSDGKPSNEVAIHSDGTWYRVNPLNGDSGDAWDIAKQFSKDAAMYYLTGNASDALKEPASHASELLGLGAGAAAEYLSGGTLTPMAAGVAGGTSALVRTSLGRVLGTYDASPQEQAWDTAYEGILNAVGVKILTGVKPTAKWVANNAIEPIGNFFADTAVANTAGAIGNSIKGLAQSAVNLPKTAFRQLFAAFSVGDRSFDQAVTKGPALRQVMNMLYSDGGSEYEVYHDRANLQQLTDIQGLANQAEGTMSKVYGTMRNKILAQIPDNFSANLEDGVNGAYSDAVKKGLGQIVTTSGQKLEGNEAMQWIADNGMGKATFRMFDQPDMARRIQAGASLASPDGKIALGQLANDTNAYNVVKQFYDRLGVFQGGMNRTGAEGAAALMDFNKVTTNLAQSLANSDTAKQTPGLASIIMDGKKAIYDSVSDALSRAKPGLDKSLADLNNTYTGLRQATGDLLAKNQAATAGDNLKALQPVLNDMVGPKGAVTRNAVDTLISTARSQGLEAEARALEARKSSIDLYQAAKDFNPIKPGTFKADQSSSPLIQMAKNATAAPFRSPNVAQGAAGMESLAKATVHGLFNGQQTLLSLPKKQVQQLMNDPVAMGKYLTGITQAPQVRGLVQGTLNNMLQQVQQQGQQR